MDLQQGLQLIDGPIQLLDLHKLLGVTTFFDERGLPPT